MEISKRCEGNVTVLNIHGTIALGESQDKFTRAMDELLVQDGTNVLVNFAGINYVDSTGIGELIGYLNKFLENNGQLKILKPQFRIRRLLQITKLDTIFEIYEDEASALKSFA